MSLSIYQKLGSNKKSACYYSVYTRFDAAVIAEYKIQVRSKNSCGILDVVVTQRHLVDKNSTAAGFFPKQLTEGPGKPVLKLVRLAGFSSLFSGMSATPPSNDSSSKSLPRPVPISRGPSYEDARNAHLKFHNLYGGLRAVSRAEVEQLPPGTLLVDVRTPAEVAVSRVPGSVTAKEFEQACAEGAPPTGVVAVCTVGLRAALWGQGLREKGFEGDVTVSEGVLLWALDGGELVRPVAGKSDVWESVQEVHTFDVTHRFAPEGWNMTHYSAAKAAWHGSSYLPAMIRARHARKGRS